MKRGLKSAAEWKKGTIETFGVGGRDGAMIFWLVRTAALDAMWRREGGT